VNEQPASLPSVFEDGDAYDLVLKDIPYGLDFYVALARAANGPVLDIACGTGRILLPCLQAGVDIEGLDLYEPMLRTLRAKGAALGLSPRLHQADMSDFSLPRRFALIMIPFNAFIHNMTQEAQIGCLRLCREHLLPSGNLTFDTFFPSLEFVSTPSGTRPTTRASNAVPTTDSLRHVAPSASSPSASRSAVRAEVADPVGERSTSPSAKIATLRW